MEIGPQIPKHILAGANDDDDEDAYGPSTPPRAEAKPLHVAGPQLPTRPPVAGPSAPPRPPAADAADEDEDEEAYAPALPPDLIARPTQPLTPSSSKRTLGPSRPGPAPHPSEGSDDEVGPMPAPTSAGTEEDAVQEFIAREQRRAAAAEEAANATKKPVREEWMLVPPSSSSLLGSLDPTKLKARQFSRSARPDTNKQDSSLWTETPAERQARVKDEVHGKRRRATEVADVDVREEDRKRRRHDEAVTARVAQYNRENRAESLVDMHKASKAADPKDTDKDTPIWDHARDMSVGGRLMDETQRSKMISEARSLGDRFGKGKSSGWL